MTRYAETALLPVRDAAARVEDVLAIATALNRPAELARCLDAIVADQGDGCAEAVLGQRSGRGVRLVYVRQPRLGPLLWPVHQIRQGK